MKNKRLTPFLDSSTTHSTVSRLMVVTVCRVDNHPSRFLSPAYSILHSYEHKFKNHTFFIYIIRNHNVHLHKSYATTFPNVVHVLLFLTIVIILLPKGISIRTPHAITCINPSNKPPTVSKSSVWFKAFLKENYKWDSVLLIPKYFKVHKFVTNNHTSPHSWLTVQFNAFYKKVKLVSN